MNPNLFPTEAEQRHADAQRLLVLAGTEEQHPLWQAILSWADEHLRNELATALRPHKDGDGVRQFEAGRAASAADFAAALRDLKVAADKYARKLKEG